MSSPEYRVESNHPISGRIWPSNGAQQYIVHDRALAVALTAKCSTLPIGQEIRVVHVPTGEILFRKQAA